MNVQGYYRICEREKKKGSRGKKSNENQSETARKMYTSYFEGPLVGSQKYMGKGKKSVA